MTPLQRTDLQHVSQFLRTVAHKGRSVCQMFYKLLQSCDPFLYEGVPVSPASDSGHQHPLPLPNTVVIDRHDTAPMYIINIHDSTLNNCIFGSNNGQSINADHQFYSPELVRHETERCSCRCDQQGSAQPSSSAPQSLQVYSCDLEYVIIGDNNTLTVQNEEGEEEEQELI